MGKEGLLSMSADHHDMRRRKERLMLGHVCISLTSTVLEAHMNTHFLRTPSGYNHIQLQLGSSAV